MTEFPKFMRNPVNAMAASQKTEGVEGYVFDGADGIQMAFFQCANSGVSAEHVHDFEEYFVVLQGVYTLIMGSDRINKVDRKGRGSDDRQNSPEPFRTLASDW